MHDDNVVTSKVHFESICLKIHTIFSDTIINKFYCNMDNWKIDNGIVKYDYILNSFTIQKIMIMVIEIVHLFVFSKFGDFKSIFEHHVTKKIQKRNNKNN